MSLFMFCTKALDNAMADKWQLGILIITTFFFLGHSQSDINDFYGDESCIKDGKRAREITEGLDRWCYEPKGKDCKWYTKCLGKHFESQRNDKESYALGFAEPICTAFGENQGKFSPLGGKWIDATRACLQRKLVPALSKTPDLSDEEIWQIALQTHVECYTDPAPGDPVFCTLPWSDIARIAWITKGAFFDRFSDSVDFVLNLLKGCSLFLG